MTALEWIRKFESYLTLVKNRSANTVRSYVIDAELLYRYVTTGKLGQKRVKVALVESAFDWGEFSEEKAVEYLRAMKKSGAKDTSIARRVYALRQFFKFLRKKRATAADPWGDIDIEKRLQGERAPEPS